VSPKPIKLSDEDFAMLARLEAGEHTFRPGNPPRPGEEFDWLVAHLHALRQRGLLRFPDSRIMKREDGRVLAIGPVDLTVEGREALERDRRLGPRSSG
jgi:hypothetical protein